MTDKCNPSDAACPQAAQVAKEAVRNVFAILGVDVDNPREVEQFRESLRFSDKLRRAADHGFLAFAGMLVVAIGAALWAGLVSKIGGH